MSKVFMVRSLEEVWRVWGVYLFQSRERTSAWGWAVIVAVATPISIRSGGEYWGKVDGR
jgi:hypothetical protein